MAKLIKLFSIVLIFIFIGIWFYLKNENQEFSLNFKSLWENFNANFLVLSALGFLLISLLRGSRFYFFIHKRISKEKRKAFNVILLSLPLGFFFTGSGLVFKSVFLKKKSGVPVVPTISFFSLGKLIDLFVIGIMFITLGYFFFAQNSFWLEYTDYIYILFFTTSGFFLILYWRNFFLKNSLKVIHLFSKKIKWKRKVFYFQKALNEIFSWQKVIVLLALTLSIWLSEWFFIYSLLKTFSAEISFSSSWVIFVLIQLCIVFPVAPSGVGIWETAFIIAGSILNFNDTNLLTIALATHLLITIFFILFFLVVFYFLDLNFQDLKKAMKNDQRKV